MPCSDTHFVPILDELRARARPDTIGDTTFPDTVGDKVGETPVGANPPPKPKSKGRGGKRPSAGAPKGNLNALKHGRRSRQFAEIGAALARSPAAREALLQLARRHQVKEMKADELAAHLMGQIVARGLQRGKDRSLIVLPPTPDDTKPGDADTHAPAS